MKKPIYLTLGLNVNSSYLTIVMTKEREGKNILLRKLHGSCDLKYNFWADNYYSFVLSDYLSKFL